MPLTLTRLDRGAAPDDEDADSAYVAAGKLNENMTATEEAIETIDAILEALGTAANEDVGSFAAASHVHAISGVTGLQAALDGKSATGHGHAIADITGLQTALDGKSATSHTHADKADLVGGFVPSAQIPAVAITEFLGSPASQVAMLALSGQKGDWCIRTDTGGVYVITGDDPTDIGDWTGWSYPGAPVTTVNGQTGTVVLGYADVGAASSAQGTLAGTAMQPTIFDAHTILAAAADNTPAALTVGEQTLVGRITGGNIAALTASQIRTLVNVADGSTAGATWGSNITSQPAIVGQAEAEAGSATTERMWTAQRVAQAIAALAGSGNFKADGSVDMTGEFRTDVGLFDSDVADGASANAYVFNTHNTFNTAGANLLRLSNNATPVFDLSFQGGIDHANSGASTAAHSQSLNLNFISNSAKTSSGQYSVVIGDYNTASAGRSVAIGESNTASGSYAVALGKSNTVSGANSFAVGLTNTVSNSGSAAFGTEALVANRSTIGLGATYLDGVGDYQTSWTSLHAATTDGTQTAMTADTTAFVISADTTWVFSALVVGRSNEADGNESAAYRIEGCIARDESNNTALVGSVTVTTIAESAGAAAWSVTAEADDTNEALAIKVTGEAATAIHWSAKVDVSQVVFA